MDDTVYIKDKIKKESASNKKISLKSKKFQKERAVNQFNGKKKKKLTRKRSSSFQEHRRTPILKIKEKRSTSPYGNFFRKKNKEERKRQKLEEKKREKEGKIKRKEEEKRRRNEERKRKKEEEKEKKSCGIFTKKKKTVKALKGVNFKSSFEGVEKVSDSKSLGLSNKKKNLTESVKRKERRNRRRSHSLFYIKENFGVVFKRSRRTKSEKELNLEELRRKMRLDERKYAKLEVQMDDIFLKKIGLGKTKCLCCVRVYYFKYMYDKRNREEICFAICRDFCGCFAIFLMKYKKKRIIELFAIYPIINPVKIDMIGTTDQNNPRGSKFKFRFTVEGEDILLQGKQKVIDEIQKNINYIFNLFTKRFSKKMFSIKFACLDYINSFFQKMSTSVNYSCEIEDFLNEILNDDSSSLLFYEKIIKYRNRNQSDFQRGLEFVCKFLYLDTFKKGIHLNKCLELCKVFIETPNTLTRNGYQIIYKIQSFLEKFKKEKLFAKVVNELMLQIEHYFRSLLEWKGRGVLPAIDFPPDKYVADSEVSYIPNQMLFASKKFESGVYLSLVMFNEFNELLVDKTTDNLPSFKIPYININQIMTNEINLEKEFDWIHSLGGFEFSKTLKLTDSLTNSFRRGLFHSVVNLSKMIGNSDLGIVYNNIVELFGKSNKKVILFLSVNQVEKNEITFPESFVWREKFAMEHLIYQKYFNISIIQRLEKLPIKNDRGIVVRFIDNSIQYFFSMKNQIEAGFYLGYVKFITKPEGVFLLVDKRKPNLIPLEFVQKEKPRKRDWKRIQKLRFMNSLDSIKPKRKSCSNFLTLMRSKKKFSERFYDSFWKFKEKVPYLDICQLYDFVTIKYNEENTIFVCCFVQVVDTDELSFLESKNYQWINEQIFCQLYFSSYFSKLFLQLFLREKRKYQTYNDTVYSSDEYFKCNIDYNLLINGKKNKFVHLIDLEKKWFNLNWIMKIYDWSSENLSITHSEKNKGDKFEDIIGKKIKEYNLSEEESVIRKVFENEMSSNRKNWRNIEKQLNFIEKQQVKEKNKTKSLLKKKIESNEKQFEVKILDFDCNIDDLFDNENIFENLNVCESVMKKMLDIIEENELKIYTNNFISIKNELCEELMRERDRK